MPLDLLKQENNRALLVGTYPFPKDRVTCEDHLKELASLCTTLDLLPIIKVPCHLREIDVATFLGKGKVEEIAQLCEENQIDLVIWDEDISPQQQKNLEKIFQRTVIDRTELILAVFAQRAHTREAKIQVELAQTHYQLPRLRRLWTHLERQRTGGGGGGGGGYLRGAGEKQIEIDRQIVRQQISKLEKDLEEVQRHRQTQKRARKRSGIPSFAIIGYTNAGKSTLMNGLTDAEVFVEDKLFATLDTTTRKFFLPNHQEILLIDTVGFIRKLPHALVAAFRSTLEEAIEADILLHLIDVAHPQAEEHAKTTYEVLRELHADKKPIITVLNKIDLCSDKTLLSRLSLTYPKTVLISALRKEGFTSLLERMMKELSTLRKVVTLLVPQSEYSLVSALMEEGRVLSSTYEENNILLEVELTPEWEGRITPFLVPKEAEG